MSNPVINTIQHQNDILVRIPDQYISVPMMASLLSSLTQDTTQDDYQWEIYSSISIINRPIQLYTLLRSIDLSCLSSTHYNNTMKLDTPSHLHLCRLRLRLAFTDILMITPLQMFKVLLDLTYKIEWRMNIPLVHNNKFHSISLNSTVNNPLCVILAPWIRMIRIMKDEYIKYLKHKTVALSATCCRIVSGFYNTDSNELLLKSTSTGSTSTSSSNALELNVVDINNSNCFTDERITHIIIQLAMQRFSNYSNYINILQTVKMLLQNNGVYQQTMIKCGYPYELTMLEQKLFDTTSVNIFDRLVAGYFLNLKTNNGTSGTIIPYNAYFVPQVYYYESYDSLTHALLTYGNYIISCFYDYIVNDEEDPFPRDGLAFLFIPNMTAKEVDNEFHFDAYNRTFESDVQWKNGLLGTIVQVVETDLSDLTRRNIVMLYSTYPMKQPNFLFAMMSFFTSNRYLFALNSDSGLNSTELQDLDRYAKLNPASIKALYNDCWKMEGPIIKNPIHWTHNWISIREWILSMGELIHTFVRCVMRCKDSVQSTDGIFNQEGSSSGKKEVYDTKMITKLLDWLPLFVKATSHFSQIHYSEQKNTPLYENAYKELIHVLICFYTDSIDVYAVSDPMNYFVEECKTFESNVKQWFSDKRVMTVKDDSLDTSEARASIERDEYHGGTMKVVDKWLLIRQMLHLALGGGISDDEYSIIKKYTNKQTPFLVFNQLTKEPTSIGTWIDGGNTGTCTCLLRDTVSIYKTVDTSALITSIIPSDIVINKEIKTRFLRLFTDTAKLHTLTIPPNTSVSSVPHPKPSPILIPVSTPSLVHQSTSLPILAPYQELQRRKRKAATTKTIATPTNPQFSDDEDEEDESMNERKDNIEDSVEDETSVFGSHTEWTRTQRNKIRSNNNKSTGGEPVVPVVRCTV